jgi:hypothetical protein
MATDGFEHLTRSCPAVLKELMSNIAARVPWLLTRKQDERTSRRVSVQMFWSGWHTMGVQNCCSPAHWLQRSKMRGR